MSSVCLAGIPIIEGTASEFALPFLTIYFVGMTLTWGVEWYATGRQMLLLKDVDEAMKDWKEKDNDIKECYGEEKIKTSMNY